VKELGHVALIGRENPAVQGGAPFHPIGSGVCVDENGLVVTAYHVVQAFQRTWGGPYDLPATGHVSLTVERHEHLSVAFMLGLSDTAGAGDLAVSSVIEMVAAPHFDLAILELGARDPGRPFPHLDVALAPARQEQLVTLAGFTSSDTAGSDVVGLPLGWLVGKHSCPVARVEQDCLFIHGAVPKGYSGGPVYDEGTRRLHGVIVETWSAELAREKLGIASPITKAVGTSIIGALKSEIEQSARARVAAGGVSYLST
jgi:hypothetical protein